MKIYREEERREDKKRRATRKSDEDEDDFETGSYKKLMFVGGCLRGRVGVIVLLYCV